MLRLCIGQATLRATSIMVFPLSLFDADILLMRPLHAESLVQSSCAGGVGSRIRDAVGSSLGISTSVR